MCRCRWLFCAFWRFCVFSMPCVIRHLALVQPDWLMFFLWLDFSATDWLLPWAEKSKLHKRKVRQVTWTSEPWEGTVSLEGAACSAVVSRSIPSRHMQARFLQRPYPNPPLFRPLTFPFPQQQQQQ